MYNIMNNSITGMSANQGKIDIISNNIANSQTVGYKKLDSGFLDLYTDTLSRQSYPHNGDNLITGTGVKLSSATRNLTQGALKETGINTEIAIDGDGYFRVISNDGTYKYTRNGEFSFDSNGKLVDDSGNILDITYNQGINGQGLNLSNGDLTISNNGQVFLNKQSVGSITLYMPQGNNDFTSVGDNLFALNDGATLTTVENPKLHQGYIEMSNVSMQAEMTDLIMAQRAFQFNSRAMQSTNEMWEMINNLRSR